MKISILVHTEIEVVLPLVPSLIRTANKDVGIPIGDLSDAQLREIGDKWTTALIEKAQSRRTLKA